MTDVNGIGVLDINKVTDGRGLLHPTISKPMNIEQSGPANRIYRPCMDGHKVDRLVPIFYVLRHISSGKYYAGYKCNERGLLEPGGYPTSSKRIMDVIVREGLCAFEIIRVRYFQTGKLAHAYEVRFLKKVKARNNPRFFNGTEDGTKFGMAGVKFSAEHRLKISMANKGKSPSAETREKISKKLKGIKVGPPSAETRAKLSALKKGIPFSDEHKKKLSAWQKGIKRGKRSPEVLASIKAKMAGRPKRVVSDETKRKMSEAHRRRFAKERADIKTDLVDAL